jgi:uncharacterized secreted protein with C-terminal beta-propeller domain
MAKGDAVLVVTEVHRLVVDEKVAAELAAAYINESGSAVTPNSVGVYDSNNLETTGTAEVEYA